MRLFTRSGRLALVALPLLFSTIAFAGQAPDLRIPPPPAGFYQVVTPTFIIETDVSRAFADKLGTMIRNAESRFYTLFKLTPDLMNGVSREPFDRKARIPGTIMYDMGFTPYVHVCVYKTEQSFRDEWFNRRGVKDPLQRLTQGIPGAYFATVQDEYDKKHFHRLIRSFLGNRDNDEIERALLHEMGHLFMNSYMLAFFGDPPPGHESQKRGMPAWLGEGVAQLFENLWSNASSSKKARMQQQAMIYEAIKLGDSYPFEKFINITNAHNLAAVASDPLASTLNYAQSASVMDYMVHVDGARFFNFLQNLRQLNFERNLMIRDKNHIPELYSFQNEAFKKAFNADITVVEDYWKKNVIKTMEDDLRRNPELYYWIGVYYLRRGRDKVKDFAAAQENFTKAMTLAPNKGEGYLGCGQLALRSGKFDDALKELAKAVELMPQDADAWYACGVAQTNLGKLTEACDSFNKALKIFPNHAGALSGLGQASLAANKFDVAIDAFRRAYDIGHQPIYLFQQGQASFFGKQYQAAQTCFARFCDVYKMDPNGHFWYGMAAWRLNDKDFAKKELEEARKLNPADKNTQTALDMIQKGEMLTFQRETEKPAERPKVQTPLDIMDE